MAQFEIDILGCGSATPSAIHHPSCQVVNFRGRLMMIDCGEGAQVMMRKMKLSFARLSHIFISHMHGDHVFGLPGLLSTMALHDKQGAVDIYLPAEGLEVMQAITSYFCRESPFEIRFHPLTGSGGEIYADHALTVTAFPLYHRVDCYGYLLRERPKERHLRGDMVEFYNVPISRRQAIKHGEDFVTPDGIVIENARLTTDPDPSVSYAYCSDTMYDERVAEAVKGVDMLYHESTYDDAFAAQARERGHSTAREAAKIARMAGAKSLLLGHYSKRYQSADLLLEQAREEFQPVIAANEGMRIELLSSF